MDMYTMFWLMIKNWQQGNYPQITPMDTDENPGAKQSAQSASSVDKAFALIFEKHKISNADQL